MEIIHKRTELKHKVYAHFSYYNTYMKENKSHYLVYHEGMKGSSNIQGIRGVSSVSNLVVHYLHPDITEKSSMVNYDWVNADNYHLVDVKDNEEAVLFLRKGEVEW